MPSGKILIRGPLLLFLLHVMNDWHTPNSLIVAVILVLSKEGCSDFLILKYFIALNV